MLTLCKFSLLSSFLFLFTFVFNWIFFSKNDEKKSISWQLDSLLVYHVNGLLWTEYIYNLRERVKAKCVRHPPILPLFFYTFPSSHFDKNPFSYFMRINYVELFEAFPFIHKNQAYSWFKFRRKSFSMFLPPTHTIWKIPWSFLLATFAVEKLLIARQKLYSYESALTRTDWRRHTLASCF